MIIDTNRHYVFNESSESLMSEDEYQKIVVIGRRALCSPQVKRSRFLKIVSIPVGSFSEFAA